MFGKKWDPDPDPEFQEIDMWKRIQNLKKASDPDPDSWPPLLSSNKIGPQIRSRNNFFSKLLSNKYNQTVTKIQRPVSLERSSLDYQRNTNVPKILQWNEKKFDQISTL